MSIKTCKICGKTSEEADFYEGLSSRCKECHKQAVKENRKRRQDYYRLYDAKRYRQDPRVKERIERYQASVKGQETGARAKQKWQMRNKHKRRAHIAVGNAVRDGRLEKPSSCEVCGKSSKKIHGHHEDYSKALDVKWVCPSCHSSIHKGENSELSQQMEWR